MALQTRAIFFSYIKQHELWKGVLYNGKVFYQT